MAGAVKLKGEDIGESRSRRKKGGGYRGIRSEREARERARHISLFPRRLVGGEIQ